MQSRLYGSMKPGYTALESKPEALGDSGAIDRATCGRQKYVIQFIIRAFDRGENTYMPALIGSIVRPAKLRSSSAEENCLTENISSLHSVKVATPLAPLMRLFPVDLPSVDGFENRPSPASFEKLLWREL